MLYFLRMLKVFDFCISTPTPLKQDWSAAALGNVGG
jgi:hypothetical protein